MPLSRDEVRELISQETAALSAQVSELTEANNALARAVERLTLVTAGDATLGVSGLVADVASLKATRQDTMLAQAKRAGMWAGFTLLGGGVISGLWALVQWAMSQGQ